MKKRICVFCGANVGKSPAYIEAAKKLATALVDRDIALVYGGTTIGLMGTVATTVLQLGGEVYGVIPHFLTSTEYPNLNVTELFEVHTMHERKQKMHELSDGFIAIPGGFGTLEEFFETLTWGQLGLHNKPSAILNVKGYYHSLLQFFDHAIAEGFIKEKHRDLYLVEENPERVVDRLCQLML